MEAIGKLIAILPEQSGQTERGAWRRGGFVIETEEQYPKKIAFTLFGDRIDMIKSYAIGSVLRVQFSAESREWEGRWFTDLRCFRVEAFVAQPTYPQQPMAQPYPQQPVYNQPMQQPVYQPQPAQPAYPQQQMAQPTPPPVYPTPNNNAMPMDNSNPFDSQADDLPF
ncbi:MAG: DUF3127 domain-containing protein [Bacteroidales bacterium]|nr:DUF3127 domain-containing protein [Bacteroidales bacterium]